MSWRARVRHERRGGFNHDGHADTAELAEYLRKRAPKLATKLKDQQFSRAAMRRPILWRRCC